MAYIGGWGWAPYTGKKSADDAFSFSRGLVKEVTGAYYACRRNIVPHVFGTGKYLAKLMEGGHTRRPQCGCEDLPERESCHLWCARGAKMELPAELTGRLHTDACG